MKKSYNLDELIKEELEKNSEHLLDFKDISITPMEEHMRILKESINSKDKNTRSTFNSKKVVVIAISIIIISFCFSFMLDTEPIKAFRFQVLKTFVEVKENIQSIYISDIDNDDEKKKMVEQSDAIEKVLTLQQAKKEIPFKFIQPTYLPKDYGITQVNWSRFSDGSHSVTLCYREENGGFMEVIQDYNISNFNRVINMKEDAKAKEVIINEQTILILNIDENFTHAVWNDSISSYEIIGTISEEEIIKIIKDINN